MRWAFVNANRGRVRRISRGDGSHRNVVLPAGSTLGTAVLGGGLPGNIQNDEIRMPLALAKFDGTAHEVLHAVAANSLANGETVISCIPNAESRTPTAWDNAGIEYETDLDGADDTAVFAAVVPTENSLRALGGVFTSSVVPTNDEPLDIGSASAMWRHVHATALILGDIGTGRLLPPLAGDGVFRLPITPDNAEKTLATTEFVSQNSLRRELTGNFSVGADSPDNVVRPLAGHEDGAYVSIGNWAGNTATIIAVNREAMAAALNIPGSAAASFNNRQTNVATAAGGNISFTINAELNIVPAASEASDALICICTVAHPGLSTSAAIDALEAYWRGLTINTTPAMRGFVFGSKAAFNIVSASLLSVPGIVIDSMGISSDEGFNTDRGFIGGQTLTIRDRATIANLLTINDVDIGTRADRDIVLPTGNVDELKNTGEKVIATQKFVTDRVNAVSLANTAVIASDAMPPGTPVANAAAPNLYRGLNNGRVQFVCTIPDTARAGAGEDAPIGFRLIRGCDEWICVPEHDVETRWRQVRGAVQIYTPPTAAGVGSGNYDLDPGFAFSTFCQIYGRITSSAQSNNADSNTNSVLVADFNETNNLQLGIGNLQSFVIIKTGDATFTSHNDYNPQTLTGLWGVY